MIVRLKRNHIDYFRRKCILSRNEEYAILLGYRIAPALVEVHKWIYPKLSIKTPDNLETVVGEVEATHEVARELGMVVVGDIHSHPDDDIAMSPTDFKDHRKHNHCITGILSVNKNKTKLAFWEIDSPLPASVQYIKPTKKKK